MRFALLGLDPDTWQLAAEIADRAEHQLVLASVAPGDAERLRTIAPGLRTTNEWESLLTGESADAVIVSRDANQDLRADQLRKLMQIGVPMIVSHPAQESMLVCYELDMIRQESRCRALSYTSPRFSPAYDKLLSLVASGSESSLGEVEQIIVERSLADRSPARVREVFARDMDLVRPISSDLSRLAAMAPTSEPTGYANLGVQLSGATGVLVRWSIAPVDQSAGVRLSVVCSRGRAVIDFRDESATARVEWTTETASGAEDLSANGASSALARFAELQQGHAVRPNWVDACRAVELADSIQRSLEKGRTVELHYEDYTEEGTFKGTMTSVGCGLLWISCLVLIVGVVAAGFRLPLSDYWPHFLLLALGVFLLLQLLQFAFPNKQAKKPEADR